MFTAPENLKRQQPGRRRGLEGRIRLHTFLEPQDQALGWLGFQRCLLPRLSLKGHSSCLFVFKSPCLLTPPSEMHTPFPWCFLPLQLGSQASSQCPGEGRGKSALHYSNSPSLPETWGHQGMSWDPPGKPGSSVKIEDPSQVIGSDLLAQPRSGHGVGLRMMPGVKAADRQDLA